MTDIQIERKIQDKGMTAPRVTPNDIEANTVGVLLEALPDSYALESAIASTASLLTESQSKYVFDQLAAQFDALLAEQLRQLTA